MKARQDIKQIGLWGMSQGGWLAPFAAALSENIAFLIVVSGATITPAEQMLYSATFALEENGFTDAEIDEMRALRKLYDDYYRNKASRAATQKRLKEAESQAWFQFSYMSTDLPDNVETTKWHKILDFDLGTFIDRVEVPTLLMYGEIDPWIPVDESISQWQKGKTTNLVVKRVKDANHFMLSISSSGVDGMRERYRASISRLW